MINLPILIPAEVITKGQKLSKRITSHAQVDCRELVSLMLGSLSKYPLEMVLYFLHRLGKFGREPIITLSVCAYPLHDAKCFRGKLRFEAQCIEGGNLLVFFREINEEPEVCMSGQPVVGKGIDGFEQRNRLCPGFHFSGRCVRSHRSNSDNIE